jgi:hypothetical protein
MTTVKSSRSCRKKKLDGPHDAPVPLNEIKGAQPEQGAHVAQLAARVRQPVYRSKCK